MHGPFVLCIVISETVWGIYYSKNENKFLVFVIILNYPVKKRKKGEKFP